MLRTLCLLSVLTVACAGETQFVQPEGQDDAWLRDSAAEAWAQAGVEAPADYSLLFLDAETLLDACNLEAPAVGMVAGCRPADTDVVLLWEGADTDLQLSIVIHELGHIMTNSARHLDCPEVGADMQPGHDMMCLTRAPIGTLPTARDAAFVQR